MNKQKNNTKGKRSARLTMRASDEEKKLITTYCKQKHISMTDFALDSMFSEMKRKSLAAEINNQLEVNHFYNYVVSYSAKSPTVKKMLDSYMKGEF